MPTTIRNPIPDWLQPQNASVLDPAWVTALRTIASVIGANDPQAQVTALMAPMNVGEVESPIAKVVTAIAAKVKSLRASPQDVAALAEKLKLATGGKPKAVAEVVADRTHALGGFSVNPRTGEIPQEGVMVGRYPNQSQRTANMPPQDLTPAAVTKFLKANADVLAKEERRPTHVGGWMKKDEAGTPLEAFLDVSEKHDTVRSATKRGELQTDPAMVRNANDTWPNGQEQVYDVASGTESPVGNLADFLRGVTRDSDGRTFQQRLDEMFTAGEPVMADKQDWWGLPGGPYEDVYGPDRLRQNAGFLAATSPETKPIENARVASEYTRRAIKGEPIIQPDYRIPDDAVAFTPGKQMKYEQSRIANLEKAAAGDLDAMRMDKINDMAHANIGDDVSVIDRRFAKVAEDPKAGIYAGAEPNLVEPAMDYHPEGGPGAYAWFSNAVIDGAKRNGMTVKKYSATVWEGIGETIRTTGELFGVPHPASAIPEAEGGFNDILPKLVAEKASKLGITVPEMVQRLRSGDANLLAAVLSTPAGLQAYRAWAARTGAPQPESPPAGGLDD
jgi:hypothetical protein